MSVDWEGMAEAARLHARTDRPWVLIGHAIYRNVVSQAKRGRMVAFREGKRVPYEFVTRGTRTYASVWVRYTGRRKE